MLLTSRRAFLALAATHLIRPTLAQKNELPITGAVNPALAPFDKLMTTFVEENKIPGAVLAVTRGGKLIYARGFGFANREKKVAVPPDALFRIASVSKPITAVGILQLVEQKKLKLEDKVWDRMKLMAFIPNGGKVDPRWKDVTVLQCLQHTAGWDRNKSYDPIGRPWEIAKSLGIRPPVSPGNLVRYMMGQPLDFDPGERHAYSNLGYLVLGRLIESISGQSYEEYIQSKVLTPLKVKGPQLGRALVMSRAKGEVAYYDSKGRKGKCLYPPIQGREVPLPDGAANFEAYEAHGGWIASAIDLVKFASAFDNPKKCALLREKSIERMWARPEGAAGKEKNGQPRAAFYGCGWMVRPVVNTGKATTWHTGFISGSEAILVRRWDGLNWAVLFNTASSPDGKSLAGLIDGKLHTAADQVKKWPNGDLFAKYLKQ